MEGGGAKLGGISLNLQVKTVSDSVGVRDPGASEPSTINDCSYVLSAFIYSADWFTAESEKSQLFGVLCIAD